MNFIFAALEVSEDTYSTFAGWNASLLGFLENLGLSSGVAQFLIDLTWFVIVLLIAYIAYLVAHNVVVKGFGKVKNSVFSVLRDTGLFRRLSYFVPWFVVRVSYKFIWSEFSGFTDAMQKLMAVLFVFMTVLVLNSILSAGVEFYHRSVKTRAAPITGFVQFIKMGIYLYAIIIGLSILLGKEPTAFLAGLTAASAVLMLVFKDSILGLVAGFQILANNMVKIGDWIEMPKYDADGDVIDITLTTVKVQNWDKTISTIPAYYLITDAVKNWRGMEESGGRRIARSVNIDMHSVKFCSSEMLEQFKKIGYLTEYIEKTEREIETYNKEHHIDNAIVVNGRRQTNLGIFRAYVKNYLINHPRINQNMTLLVRQMPLTEKGIPLQIYCFTNTTAWAEYENIQSDIFDHILATLPYFELSAFQNIGGRDFYRRLDESNTVQK